MVTILIYIAVIAFGFILSKRGFISKSIEKRTGKLQTYSLFLLLGTMGYKIGADEKIISNFHKIGYESFVVSAFAIVFSVLFTFLGVKVISRVKGKVEERC